MCVHLEASCQELDGSRLLDVSKVVVLWNKKSVVLGSMVQRRAQSSNWTDGEKENWNCQETGEYKTGVKYSY